MWRVLGAVGLTMILMAGVCLAAPAEVASADATVTQSRVFKEKLDLLDDRFIIPFVHDADDPTGMTTLIAIQRTLPLAPLPLVPNGQGAKAAETVTVEWFSTQNQSFGSRTYQIEQFGTQTINSRIVGINFDPGGTGGLIEGFILVTTLSNEYFVDYIQVDFTNNFANGDVAFAQADGVCDWWRVRYMNGGPFAGGSEIWILINDPLLAGQISGTIDFYDEPGNYLPPTYELKTGHHVYSLNVADIAPPLAVFGSMEVKINNGSTYHGLVRGSLTAGGLYSLAMNGVCIREQGP